MIGRAVDGDSEALRELYVTYSGSVHGYVRRLIRDEQEAQDITQLVFLKLMSSLHLFDARRGDFQRWIFSVAHRAALDHLRRRLPIPVGPLPAPDGRTDEPRGLRVHALREALAELPEQQCRVLLLRHLAGYGPDEIAVQMAKTPDAVNAIHRRARAGMRASLVRLESAPCTLARP